MSFLKKIFDVQPTGQESPSPLEAVNPELLKTYNELKGTNFADWTAVIRAGKDPVIYNKAVEQLAKWKNVSEDMDLPE